MIGEGERKISGVSLANWLVEKEYLSVVKDAEDNTRNKLGERSFELDIIEVDREFNGVKYKQLPQSQKFLIDNLDEIFS